MQAIWHTDNLQFQVDSQEIPTKGMMDVKGIMYSIPCAECSATRVGDTRRTLRVTSHGVKCKMQHIQKCGSVQS